MRSARLLLLLGVSVPSVFLADQTGARSMATVVKPEPISPQSVVKFAPNLNQKLKTLMPDHSDSHLLASVKFLQSFKEKGDFYQSKS